MRYAVRFSGAVSSWTKIAPIALRCSFTNRPFAGTRPARSRSAACGIGGDNPIWVQSMTTPDTLRRRGDASREIHRARRGRLRARPRHRAQAGGRRGPRRDQEAASSIPLICDIHFDYKMALAALDHPIDKIRINPGNIGGMRPLPPGHPQGQGQGHPDADRRQRRQPGTRVRR